MGIRDKWFLNSALWLRKPISSLDDLDTIIIDISYIAYVLMSGHLNRSSCAADVLLSRLLFFWLRKFLRHVPDTVQVHVVFDGVPSVLKEGESMRRLDAKQKVSSKLESTTRFGEIYRLRRQALRIDRASLDKARAYLADNLEMESLHFHQSVGESDMDIRVLAERNPNHLLIASDNDFMILPGVALCAKAIQFEKVNGCHTVTAKISYHALFRRNLLGADHTDKLALLLFAGIKSDYVEKRPAKLQASMWLQCVLDLRDIALKRDVPAMGHRYKNRQLFDSVVEKFSEYTGNPFENLSMECLFRDLLQLARAREWFDQDHIFVQQSMDSLLLVSGERQFPPMAPLTLPATAVIPRVPLGHIRDNKAFVAKKRRLLKSAGYRSGKPQPLSTITVSNTFHHCAPQMHVPVQKKEDVVDLIRREVYLQGTFKFKHRLLGARNKRNIRKLINEQKFSIPELILEKSSAQQLLVHVSDLAGYTEEYRDQLKEEKLMIEFMAAEEKTRQDSEMRTMKTWLRHEFRFSKDCSIEVDSLCRTHGLPALKNIEDLAVFCGFKPQIAINRYLDDLMVHFVQQLPGANAMELDSRKFFEDSLPGVDNIPVTPMQRIRGIACRKGFDFDTAKAKRQAMINRSNIQMTAKQVLAAANRCPGRPLQKSTSMPVTHCL